MFYRGNAKQKQLLPQRKFRKKKADALNHPEWDSTIQDLKVHAATPGEIARRQIRRKSKNVDAARRELKSKRSGVPVDLLISPGQVDLEMKKLAILKEVLYDHNDLNELLRRTDETMSSAKNIFYDTSLTASHPNVTLAPNSKTSHPLLKPEPMSKLDTLSESMIDNHALNEMSTHEERFETEVDDSHFNSHLSYNQIAGLLQETLRQNEGGKENSNNMTGTAHWEALNDPDNIRTVLGTLQNTSKDNKLSQPVKNEAKEIKKALSSISKDANHVQSKLNASMNTALPLPQKAESVSKSNVSSQNMTYNDLQGAMEHVQQNILAFEESRGHGSRTPSPGAAKGLGGFTATMVDAITRLFNYVNDGELRLQSMEKLVQEMKTNLSNQVSLNESLKKDLAVESEKVESLALHLQKVRDEIKEKDSERDYLKAKLETFDQRLIRLENEREKQGKQNIELEPLANEYPTPTTGAETKLDNSESNNDSKVKEESNLADSCSTVSEEDSKKQQNMALKMDMVALLNALRSENDKSDIKLAEDNLPGCSTETCGPTPLSDAGSNGNGPILSDNIGTLESVEDQLRLLKHQHAEAEQRMTKLAKHVQGISEKPISIGGEVFQITAGLRSDGIEPKLIETSRPVQTIKQDSKKNVQSNINYDLKDAILSKDSSTDGSNPPNKAVGLQGSEDSPVFDNEPPTPGKFWLDISDQNFKTLEHDTVDSESAVSFMLSDVTSIQSPKFVQQQEAVLSKIRQTQMSLEDRISQLNQQHSQAQSRLHRLVARKKSSSSSSSAPKQYVTESMFETPCKPTKSSTSDADFNDTSCWFALSNDNTSTTE